MKKPISLYAKAGARLAFCVAALLWSAHASADDAMLTVATTADAQGRQVVRLPALKANGMRNGDALLVTERGAEYVKPERLAQPMTLMKTSALDGLCLPR